ncbi:spore cortex biosynthesis protein YabQ [Hydrogenispora ethanolica]|jgi:spore cortex biosynthesis protein YabQ|uniref:Spore cortex biosynthesis protein YabQ n=1 Tax=Hydrogenispora ethanolica TaxID=1082276 RepID=A0A4R1S252_HYDET|nr:spore cortex biosynthesis protein YabQ [Hydrogenispora ethanolica]TCL73255.1 spore cortex biosynthesis protein YabQ [Hydrogenispora ethanolica]
MEYLQLQVSSFLILFATGLFLGGFFDLYRVFRCRIRTGFLVDFLGDLLFWLLALAISGCLIYWSTWLELRAYVWLTLLLGVAFYFCCFSAALIPIFLRFWQGVGWLPRQFAKGAWQATIMARKLKWLTQRGKMPGRKPEDAPEPAPKPRK